MNEVDELLSHLDGRGPVNPKGLQFYKNFIKELVAYGEKDRERPVFKSNNHFFWLGVEFGFSSY